MSALVGLDDLVLALVLAAIDPAIGGVLLRGDKGSAKTTAARALAFLLPGGAPFVEIPLGATEDRVVGSVDVAAVLVEGEHRFQAGLLQAADGGVLYVDEVNLLADHLVDVLLDAAASGVNRVERDGLSHVHSCRFLLIGSMNPEEGELRPQLLDRFGLSVRVTAPSDPKARAEAVRRRLAFDEDPEAFRAAWADAESELAERLATTRPAPLEAGLEEAVAGECAAAGAQGLRADLVICRAAAALAGWRGRPTAGAEEVAVVAPLALAHRRASPFEPAPTEAGAVRRSVGGSPTSEAGGGHDRVTSPESSGTSVDATGGPADEPGATRAPEANGAEPPGRPTGEESRTRPAPSVPSDLLEGRRTGGAGRPGRHRSAERDGPVGRIVGQDRIVEGARGPVAAGPTVLATTLRTGRARPLEVTVEDLRVQRREARGDRLVVLAVDTSGSMGIGGRVEAARAAVMALVADAYQRRDRVALVIFHGAGAEVLLRPTSSTEVALARLATIPTGGRTPLWSGIDAARRLALAARRGDASPLVVVVSDGRATSGPAGQDPVAAAIEAARAVAASRLEALVVDCGGPGRPLGLGPALAEAMGARRVRMAIGEGEDVGRAMARSIVEALG